MLRVDHFPSCLRNLPRLQWVHWCTRYLSLLVWRERCVLSSEWCPKGFPGKGKEVSGWANLHSDWSPLGRSYLLGGLAGLDSNKTMNRANMRRSEHPLSLLWNRWVTSQGPWDQFIGKLPSSFSGSILKERPFCLCSLHSFFQGPHLTMQFPPPNSLTYSPLAPPLSRRSSFHLHPRGSGWAAVAAYELRKGL